MDLDPKSFLNLRPGSRVWGQAPAPARVGDIFPLIFQLLFYIIYLVTFGGAVFIPSAFSNP